MKKIVCLSIIIFAFTKINAGVCNISGQENSRTERSFRLYLLYAGAHYRNQYIDVVLQNDGRFSQNIALTYPVFALLTYNGHERRLLLSPGRNLQIVFDAKLDTDSMKMSGKGAAENNLLFQLRIGDQPFFMKDGAESIHAKMPADSLQKNVLNVLKKKYAEAKNSIAMEGIPRQLQEILLNELHYANQCYLYDLAGNSMRWAKNKDQQVFLDTVMTFEQLPDSTMLVSGLFANMSLEYFERYQMMYAGRDMRTDSTSAIKNIEQMLGMPFDEIKKQIEKYGERYILGWLYAKHNFPVSVQDKILFNRISESCDSKELSIGILLGDTLRHYFPNSHYLPMAEAELNKLKQMQQAQLQNEKIVVHDKKKLTSLTSLPELYPGKVIYVDIWGTWCPPCRAEMQYAPQLKERFAGKAIVFVYIDMDKATKEAAWKEMLHLYALEGEHYRLDSDEIAPLWKEIGQEGGQTDRYPTYVLFDKHGKMVKANAGRPSDGEKLYKEIEEAFY